MTEIRDTDKLSRGDKRVIAKFWDKNYQYGYDSGSKVKADDTYRLFIEVHPGRNISKASFIKKSTVSRGERQEGWTWYVIVLCYPFDRSL